MKDQECIQLDCQNARFGFALSAIGDVDLDGFQGESTNATLNRDACVFLLMGTNAELDRARIAMKIYTFYSS